MRRWLVTGGSGFLGGHLLDRLDVDVDVSVLGRSPLVGRPDLQFIAADLFDALSLDAILKTLQPTVVVHLAGRTPPADFETLDRANRRATTSLVQALERYGRPVRLIVAGSAAELGSVPEHELPVAETYPADPDTDYGRSKLAATRFALAARPPIEVIVGRIFNPIGPGLPMNQALGRFAHTLAQGTGPLTLTVGSLAPRRDFLDVRDAAAAMIALADRGTPGLYHVGTGESRSVDEGLQILIRLSGRDVHLAVDETRPGGPADSRADSRRLREATGWSPRYSFEQSLADLWASVVVGCD